MASCSGSRKYFKAAERLEKQGLVNDAAEYYLESLQRKPTNVEARIKLRDVGQKHVSNMASEFFRNYNTQQLEESMSSYERLKEFCSKSSALDVSLDYPKAYEEDYQQTIEKYCLQNYTRANDLVLQKKYGEALGFISKVEKYNKSYKNIGQLKIIATCEPLYQTAVNNLEAKNYAGALINLQNIQSKSENYKDTRDLLELASGQQNKTFILFEPNSAGGNGDRDIEQFLFTNFSQAAIQSGGSAKIINNTPFQNVHSNATDFNQSSNVDLIQAVRKATGADYFYVFDVTGRNEYSPALSKTSMRGYQETTTRKNDTLVITEYNPIAYNLVRGQRSFSYDFKYRIINAYTNQIIDQRTNTVRSMDAIEFQEFITPLRGSINSLFPYNPQQTAPLARYNPQGWRNLFSARNNLKDMELLKSEAYKTNISQFISTLSIMK